MLFQRMPLCVAAAESRFIALAELYEPACSADDAGGLLEMLSNVTGRLAKRRVYGYYGDMET